MQIIDTAMMAIDNITEETLEINFKLIMLAIKRLKNLVCSIMEEINKVVKLHKEMDMIVWFLERQSGRTLQQTLCFDLWRNWSVSVSWGYTVQLYPSLVTAKVLGTAWLTFKTWRTRKVGPFTFNTRTVSPDPCEKPGLYFLDGIVRTGAGRTVTTYKRHVKYSENVCDRVDYTPALAIESIKVSAPQFTPDWWNKIS
ncbi:hypothetical protein PanWU01x14_368340 [Parasponia andersonii]|uniref:Uncharacterized protein n=1 Tax=Parasponia andersonii TaxID=3476 RepID=A0A2P5A527_PARAD|nr:hypothetical protein PanWU01x14_368340 [Parasponia andersonii]